MIISPFAQPRLVISGILKLETALHVGSGAVEINSQLPINDEGGCPKVNVILRDYDGKPYIPGTSLKGVLHSICLNENGCAKLFGTSHEDNGRMGTLTVFGASFNSPPSKFHLPYFDSTTKMTGITARTAINPDKGTAKEHHLFHQEEVPAGSTFNFSMEYAQLATADDLLKNLLAKLQDGFAIGADTRLSQGKVKLTDIKIERQYADKNGDWKTKAETSDWIGDSNQLVKGKTTTLVLTCDGPYLIADSTHKKDKDQDKNSQPNVQALGMIKGQNHQQVALLSGSSLKGVLRSRSLWLENGIDIETGKLFGTTDAAAKLKIRAIRTISNSDTNISSVKLDRFSGAPIEGGLFKTWCFVNPIFEVDFEVPENDHFPKLLQDMKEDGLRLGHGTNRGYGWFTVTEKAEA